MSDVHPTVQALHDAIYTLPGVARAEVSLTSLDGVSAAPTAGKSSQESLPWVALRRSGGGLPGETLVSLQVGFTHDDHGWLALQFLATWVEGLARNGDLLQMRPLPTKLPGPDEQLEPLSFVIEFFSPKTAPGGTEILGTMERFVANLSGMLDEHAELLANPERFAESNLDEMDFDDDFDSMESTDSFGADPEDELHEHDHDHEHGCDHDPEELKAAAEAGDPHAQFHLGQHLEAGDFGDPDPEGAFALYAKSAAQGYPPGLLFLGRCYEEGVGCDQDPHAAIKFYRTAANSDFPIAMAFVGKCYEEGIGVPRDEKAALRWYRKGAELEEPMCQANLGECYEQGIGTKIDLRMALTWYRAALEQGMEEMDEAIQRVEAKLN